MRRSRPWGFIVTPESIATVFSIEHQGVRTVIDVENGKPTFELNTRTEIMAKINKLKEPT